MVTEKRKPTGSKPTGKQRRESARLMPAMAVEGAYGIPYMSLRKLGHDKTIPVVRIGRSWYFDRSDIEAFIKNAKAAARAEQ